MYLLMGWVRRVESMMDGVGYMAGIVVPCEVFEAEEGIEVAYR